MTSLKPITIVGGGLAGLTLGIALRRQQVPVTLWEAGDYPRHRVCGEFVSGRGQETLRRLGLVQLFERAGAVFARSARFFLGRAATPVRSVEPGALCLSRYKMDKALAEEFVAKGGQLRAHTRWQDGFEREGVIKATGRQVQPVQQGWRWFGLKVHARGVQLETDLEMHGFANGYVGLCRLGNGETNICGLFRARPGTHSAGPIDLLRGEVGMPLHERLAKANFDLPSFCSVAGLSLLPQRALSQPDCRVGDSLTMIPPVTGNGMSMAFESAEIALSPLLAYAQGEAGWEPTRRTVGQACDAAFRERLVWAARLQSIMFSPVVRGRLGAVLLSSAWLWRAAFCRTR